MTTQNAALTTPSKPMSIPALLLRAEGLALLAAAVTVYFTQGFGWVMFAVLLLTPDLAFLVFLVNKRAGVAAYDAAHALPAPLILGLAALLTGWTLGLGLALIWLAHIGMDRLFGYGLRYMNDADDSHMKRA